MSGQVAQSDRHRVAPMLFGLRVSEVNEAFAV